MALTGTLVFAVLSAALSSFLFGYNIGVINAPQNVVSNWVREIHCIRNGGHFDSPNATDVWCKHYDNSTQMTKENPTLTTLWSVISSIFCAGALISSVTGSFFVTLLGRRGTLLVNNVTAILGSIFMLVSYYAMSFELLIVGRFVIGLNAGINSGVPPMYLTEIAPGDLRGALGTVHQLVCVFGVFISQILGLPQLLGGTTTWAFLFGFSLLPVALQLATLPFCPESPRHLYLNKHDTVKAQAALEFFQRTTDVSEEIEVMEEEYQKSKDLPRVSIPDLFRDRFLRRIMIICIMVMLSQQFSGINAVMFYSSDIFQKAGLEGNNSLYATIGMGGVFVIATVVSMGLVERAGRRLLMLVGLSGMCITTVLLVIMMKVMQGGFVWAQYMSILCVMIFVIFFAIGPGPIPWFIAAELFTQGPRAPAMSVVAGTNWLSTLLITFTFPLIQAQAEEYTFLIFTGFLVLFVAYTYLKVPETKGKKIDEIQAEMRQRL